VSGITAGYEIPFADSLTVYSLAAESAGHLFVGGSFYVGGDKVSPYLVELNLSGAPPEGLISSIGVSGGKVTMECLGVPGYSYALQRAADVRFTQSLTTSPSTNPPLNGSFRCVVPSSPDPMGFYRLRRQ
jgi:hypothetical protein